MENKEEVGKALGKVASGLYVVTTKHGETLGGFTASFVIQTSFEPPLVAIATKKGRGTYNLIMDSGVFAVNVMSKDGMKLVGHFAKPRPEGESEFEGVSYEEKTLGVPVLTDALAYLECKVHSTYDAGDHTLVFGEVVNGQVQKEGEPATHIRKNGFSY